MVDLSKVFSLFHNSKNSPLCTINVYIGRERWRGGGLRFQIDIATCALETEKSRPMDYL